MGSFSSNSMALLPVLVLVVLALTSSLQSLKLHKTSKTDDVFRRYTDTTDDMACPIGVVNTGRSIWDTTNYQDQLNPRPVIGVLTQDCVSSSGRIFTDDCTEDVGFVSAAYVKWLEASGALVHVVPLKTTHEDMTKLLQRDLSGLVIPGSGSWKPYYQALARHVVEEVVNGNVDVPVFGTCMGIEIMAKVLIDDDVLITTEGTSNVAMPMEILEKNSSKMWKGLSDDLENAFENENVTLNAHKYGFRPDQCTPDIVITGTSVDSAGITFVAAMEHTNLPIYGAQWHPEKIFEFPRSNPQKYDDTGIHTSRNALKASQFMGNFLVEQARMHKNRYTLTDKYLSYSMNMRRVTSSYHIQNYYL